MPESKISLDFIHKFHYLCPFVTFSKSLENSRYINQDVLWEIQSHNSVPFIKALSYKKTIKQKMPQNKQIWIKTDDIGTQQFYPRTGNMWSQYSPFCIGLNWFWIICGIVEIIYKDISGDTKWWLLPTSFPMLEKKKTSTTTSTQSLDSHIVQLWLEKGDVALKRLHFWYSVTYTDETDIIWDGLLKTGGCRRLHRHTFYFTIISSQSREKSAC